MPAKELVDYVVENLSKGYSADEVRAASLAGGWEEGEVNEAVALATKTAPAPAAQAVPKRNWKKTALVIVILLAVAAAVFFGLVYFNIIDASGIPVIKDILPAPVPVVENVSAA